MIAEQDYEKGAIVFDETPAVLHLSALPAGSPLWDRRECLCWGCA